MCCKIVSVSHLAVIILSLYLFASNVFLSIYLPSFVGAAMVGLIHGFSSDLYVKAGLRAAYQSLSSHYAVCPELSLEMLTEESLRNWAPWEPTQIET